MTTSGCPLPDATSCNYRSVWSLLASCSLTLLICIWHAIHPAVPLPPSDRTGIIVYRSSLVLMAFFLPEFMVLAAFDEWCSARRVTKLAHDDGHDWWTMAHSHFILSGGFALHNGTSIKEIYIATFLSLVKKGDIVNPVVMEDDIKDKSVSDGLVKVILIVQLSWFTVQIIVRLVNHLTVTLVELDTFCMALLTVPQILWWWNKPRCPGRPHIFYTRDFISKRFNQVMGGNELEKLLVKELSTITTKKHQGIAHPFRATATNTYSRAGVAFFLTWAIFGALHAIAWNYEFPTEVEKILWRAASLTLAGLPVVCFVVIFFGSMIVKVVEAVTDSDIANLFEGYIGALQGFLLLIGFVSRALLVALMLASLRSLSPSAHEIIPWTSYIPHL